MNGIAICGSMDFFEQMTSLGERLQLGGLVVQLPIREESKVDYHVQDDAALSEVKQSFIDAHLEKIRISDAVLLANFPKHDIDGYVGANTLIEAAFGYALRKQLFVLYDLGEQGCRPEMLGMRPIFLRGELEELFRWTRGFHQNSPLMPGTPQLF